MNPQNLTEKQQKVAFNVWLDGKSLLSSKTVWFNLIMIVLDIVSVLMQSPFFADKSSLLQVFALIQTIGNIILRYVTSTPITSIS